MPMVRRGPGEPPRRGAALEARGAPYQREQWGHRFAPARGTLDCYTGERAVAQAKKAEGGAAAEGMSAH